MEGIKGYSRPNADGGVTVDTEAMLVDLITVYKAGGHQQADLEAHVREIWPKVKIEVSIPKCSKNAWLLGPLVAGALAALLAASEGRADVVTRSCFGTAGTRSCVWQFGPSGNPHVIAVPGPTSAEDVAAAEERAARWEERCRPTPTTDRYGMTRLRYALPGCEYGAGE